MQHKFRDVSTKKPALSEAEGLDMTKYIHSAPDDFAAQLLLNHLFIRVIRVIRGLIVLWREGGDPPPPSHLRCASACHGLRRG
jgi:hypothetical protein